MIGLDYPAVYDEARRLGFDLSAGFVRKVKILEQMAMASSGEKKSNASDGNGKRD